jgi:hypothetical protein
MILHPFSPCNLDKKLSDQLSLSFALPPQSFPLAKRLITRESGVNLLGSACLLVHPFLCLLIYMYPF